MSRTKAVTATSGPATHMVAQFRGRIFAVQGPNNDLTQSVHVWLIDGAGRAHDIVIYDNTRLLEVLKLREMLVDPQFYNRETYAGLVGQAQAHLNCDTVVIKALNHIALEIWDPLGQ